MATIAADYAGPIVDCGSPTSLTKVGAGALTLTGRNTPSGPITPRGGDLAITGTLPTSEGWFGSVSLGTGSVLSPVTA